MVALSIGENNRILSVCAVLPTQKYDGMPIVVSPPGGDYNDYRYENGEYVYDPQPKPEMIKPDLKPSVWDELDAAYQTGYAEGYTEGVNSAYDQ